VLLIFVVWGWHWALRNLNTGHGGSFRKLGHSKTQNRPQGSKQASTRAL
jgi:hypothetical protein